MFVSHAQNLEDVLLWRALKHVPDGVYVDVGASDPELDSVTAGFYELGWRGINIEPVPAEYERLLELRPYDVNIAAVAGDAEGEAQLSVFTSNPGLATVEPGLAAHYVGQGMDVAIEPVPVRTLANICAENALGEIHFLKVDAEGAEAAVLRGADFRRWRPWVVVVEAVDPVSHAPSHDEWEPGLVAHDYVFAYFDGLNRYYVAAEHDELLAALRVQPNVLDGFRRASDVSAEEGVRAAQRAVADATGAARREAAEAALARERAAQAERRAVAAEALAAQSAADIATVAASASWRVTSPLRSAARVVRALRAVSPERRTAKTYGKLAVGHPMRWVLARPRLGTAVDRRLALVPWIDQKIRIAIHEVDMAELHGVTGRSSRVPDDLQRLPVGAREVLEDLERLLDCD